MYQRQVADRCPICGAEHASCGADPLLTAMDAQGEVVNVQGGPLQTYDVVVNGVKLRMRLSEADARKRGVWQDHEPAAVKSKAAAKPRARRAKSKMVDVEPEATGGE
ncbi:hypothetical protein ABZ635_22165 [Nocardiopsis sp. NPDC007018]|uniref:hypothetical protein n=1 Tax=Nocardiopsis sp. NPDC007018 TaxID=3155721 RepID=UPI0033EF36FF